jgi:hypothetical protein
MPWDMPTDKRPPVPPPEKKLPRGLDAALSDDLKAQLEEIGGVAALSKQETYAIRAKNKLLAAQIKLRALNEREKRQLEAEQKRENLARRLLEMTPAERARTLSIVELAMDDETKARSAEALQMALTDPKQVLSALKLVSVLRGEINLEGSQRQGGGTTVIVANGTYQPGMFRGSAGAIDVTPAPQPALPGPEAPE